MVTTNRPLYDNHNNILSYKDVGVCCTLIEIYGLMMGHERAIQVFVRTRNIILNTKTVINRRVVW